MQINYCIVLYWIVKGKVLQVWEGRALRFRLQIKE